MRSFAAFGIASLAFGCGGAERTLDAPAALDAGTAADEAGVLAPLDAAAPVPDAAGACPDDGATAAELSALPAIALAVDGVTVFFATADSLYAVPRCGGPATALVTGERGIVALAVGSGWIAWGTSAVGGGEIPAGALRARPLAGGATTTIVTRPIVENEVVIDGADVLYVTPDEASRAPLDGSSPPTQLLPPGTLAGAIALDAANLYVTTFTGGAGSIQRLPRSGARRSRSSPPASCTAPPSPATAHPSTSRPRRPGRPTCSSRASPSAAAPRSRWHTPTSRRSRSTTRASRGRTATRAPTRRSVSW